MKIIGNNGRSYGDRRYFLEASREEVANLMGYAYPSDTAVEAALEKSGADIPIGKMYDQLYRMANMETALVEISAKLKAAADFVNTALPVIGHVNGKEPPAHD